MSDVEQDAVPVLVGANKGRGLLVALALLCVLAVALASLRHTSSLAFPIDDGYIYSNYALAASQGYPFTYNIGNNGELSGGITGLGWYLLSIVAYALVSPFHGFLGSFGPPLFSQDAELSRQAGHLYLASYLVGTACLAATALGVRRLAALSLPMEGERTLARQAFCWLLGAVAAADLGLVWGAMSGLEATFAAAIAVWAAALLISEIREGKLRWSLLLVALLPWARPDLIAIGAAGLVWLLARALLPGGPSKGRRRDVVMPVLAYGMALAGGLGTMSLVYYVGWGSPLPSSFYAKVGGLRVGERFFSAAQELLAVGRYLPFVVAVVAVLGALSAWLPRQARITNYELRITNSPQRRRGRRGFYGLRITNYESSDRDAEMEYRFASLLLLLGSTFYIMALMLSLPWFGQEDRYLLPIHPFLIVLCGLLLWQLVRVFSFEKLLSARFVRPLAVVLIMFLLCLANYIWATRNYAVQVRNISDAHIAPAKWIAENTSPGSIIASEPIGAVKLFSGRRTVDLVGLTTPATLGTYRDWPRAWEALHSAGASYMLFYPRWFEGAPPQPPAWAVEEARFTIPDNKIAGDNVIAIYRLDWNAYRP